MHFSDRIPKTSLYSPRLPVRRLSGYGYEPGDYRPSIAFCDPLTVAMAELGNALDQAYSLGMEGDPAVQQGAYLYDQNQDFWSRKWLTIPGTSQCEDKAAEVTAAVAYVRQAVTNATGTPPPLLRPDYAEDAGGALGTMPSWAKLAAGGVILFLVLTQVAPIVSLFKAAVPRRSSRLAGRSQR